MSPIGSLSRRSVLRVAGLLCPLLSAPPPSRAIVAGDAVSDAEAAASGVVGLYIDLAGCQICRKGVPATCTGTLIAPDLVLTARHCLDVPEALNGTLDRVVFGSDMLTPKATSRAIEKFVSTEDYGIDAAGNDLLLIKLKGNAPAPWRPSAPYARPIFPPPLHPSLRKRQPHTHAHCRVLWVAVEVPLRLLPTRAEEGEAKRKSSPFYPEGVGMPALVSYGYGQTDPAGERDPDKYSAGALRRIGLQVRTEVRPWGAGFLTTPVKRGTGTCAGDSGGGGAPRRTDLD